MEDGFLDPASGVLRNLLGITDAAELDKVEATYTQIQLVLILENPPQTLRLDAVGLQAIHRQLFQDVYPWAGELRGWGNFQGQKDSGAASDLQTMNFASYQTLPAHLNALSEHLAADLPKLRQMPAEQFVERAAYHFDQYNYAHGFREGNGRTLAVAFTLLAEASGKQIDFLSQPTKAYNKARDYAILRPDGNAATDLIPLRDFFSRTSVPPLSPNSSRVGQAIPLPSKSPFLMQVEAMREVQQTQERIWRALLGRNSSLSREIREGTRQVVLTNEFQPRRLAALREGAEQLVAPSNSPPSPVAQQAANRLLRALPLLSIIAVVLTPRLAEVAVSSSVQLNVRQSPESPKARPEQPAKRRPRLS